MLCLAQGIVAMSFDKLNSSSSSLIPISEADTEIQPAQNASFKTSLLQADVAWGSFIAFLVACMMSISGLVFINAAQTYVILDILEYPRSALGHASGSLAFADELFCVPLVSFWGFLSDRIGRRIVMSTGLSFMAMAVALYPWASCVFPGSFGTFFRSLIFFRLIFAIGGSATTAMITALIGDFAADGSRAKVAGFTGTAAGLGALSAVLFFTRLPILFSKGCTEWLHLKRPDIILTYTTTACFLLAASLLTSIGMHGPKQQYNLNQPWKDRVRTGLFAIKRPLVALAYFSGFVARADSIALNLFIGPWVDNYLTRTGECPPTTGTELVRCEAAKRLTSNLMSTSHLATLLGAPFFGILSDRLGPVAAVAVPAALGFFSFGSLYFASQPRSLFVYLCMFGSGLADIGMIISSMSLMSSQSSPSQRGALAGVYSLFGAVGIIITSKLGGFLFDSYSETAPFSVVSISSLALFMAVGACMLFAPGRSHL